MLQQNTTKRLGYWLLLLHGLFEDDMTAALADWRLDRRRWQVLHALAIGVGTQAEIDNAFSPFLRADGKESYEFIVEEFAGRGWVASAGEVLSLTEAGTSAHAQAEEIVNAQAVKILKGLTEEEFLAANDVLRRISLNMQEF